MREGCERMFTFAMVKPCGAMYTRDIMDMITCHPKEMRIVRWHVTMLKPSWAKELYRQHADQPFFEDLINHIISGPVTTMALGGPNIIQDWRELMGATNPQLADSRTIRGMYGRGLGLPRNIVHGSDSVEAANREIALMFAGTHLM